MVTGLADFRLVQKVLCSIKKQAKEDKDILVSVDSVFYQDDMVMAA